MISSPDFVSPITKQDLNFEKQVHIFVYQQGEFNACFRRFFARRAIFVNSELLDTSVTDQELKWLIARFVGQVKVKHKLGPLAWVIAFAQRLLIFNLFILPYERATAYTGDRLALKTIDGDINAAITAFNKLLVGRELGYSIDPSGIIQQNRQVKGSFFAFLARLGQPLPHTIPRYVDLIGFASRAFPTRFRQFAAENPSLQSLVTAPGSLTDLERDAPVRTAAVSDQSPGATLTQTDLSSNSAYWGWAMLPIGYIALNVFLSNLFYRLEWYNLSSTLNIALWLILVVALLVTLVAYLRRGPKTEPKSMVVGFVLVPIVVALCLFHWLGRMDMATAVSAFQDLRVLDVEAFAYGFERFVERETLQAVLTLGFVCISAVLREVCFRGFVVGGMVKNGAGLLAISATSALLDVCIVLVTALVLSLVNLSEVFEYGLGFEFVVAPFIQAAPGLATAACMGAALGLLRWYSGSVWPGVIISALTAFGAVVFMTSL